MGEEMFNAVNNAVTLTNLFKPVRNDYTRGLSPADATYVENRKKANEPSIEEMHLMETLQSMGLEMPNILFKNPYRADDLGQYDHLNNEVRVKPDRNRFKFNKTPYRNLPVNENESKALVLAHELAHYIDRPRLAAKFPGKDEPLDSKTLFTIEDSLFENLYKEIDNMGGSWKLKQKAVFPFGDTEGFADYAAMSLLDIVNDTNPFTDGYQEGDSLRAALTPILRRRITQ